MEILVLGATWASICFLLALLSTSGREAFLLCSWIVLSIPAFWSIGRLLFP